MIFRYDYTMMGDGFSTMPIMAIDDERPLLRRDYSIETEDPIKPYTPTPVVVTKPVVMPRPDEPILRDGGFSAYNTDDDVLIVPEKPKVEFNPVVNKNTGVIDTGRIIKPKISPKPRPEPKPEPQPQPVKSINPLYIAGAIVAIILIYKILK